jgi:hypothetical protein
MEEYCIKCFCCGNPLDLFDMQVLWDILVTPNVDPTSNYADFKRKSVCKKCFSHGRTEMVDESHILIFDRLCIYGGEHGKASGTQK